MPAESKAQQRFMGMVHAVQTGEETAPSKEVAEAAKSIKPQDAKDFAATKTKSLPEHKEKSAVLQPGILRVMLRKRAAELDAASRAHITTKNFALPAKAKTTEGKKESGSYPIPDVAHARNALARVSQFGTPDEKTQVRAKVHAKYPSAGEESAKSAALLVKLALGGVPYVPESHPTGVPGSAGATPWAPSRDWGATMQSAQKWLGDNWPWLLTTLGGGGLLWNATREKPSWTSWLLPGLALAGGLYGGASRWGAAGKAPAAPAAPVVPQTGA